MTQASGDATPDPDIPASHYLPAGYHEARELRKRLGAGPKSLQSISQTVMVAEALKRGVSVDRRPGQPGLRFSHGAENHVWRGTSSSLNTPLARQLTSFKDLQSRLFLNHGIPAPENALFSPGEEWRAWAWGHSLGTLVIKPHDGTQGQNVHVGLDNWNDFSRAFQEVASRKSKILVEKFHTGVEHRFFVVDDKVAGVIRRRPASVLGDGRSTIKELVETKNRDRGVIHKPVPLRQRQLRYLAHFGYSPSSVPPQNERVYMHAPSNLHAGGDAISASHDVSPEEVNLVEEASRVIPGLRTGGFDVLLPRNQKDDGVTLIEVNHWAMVALHHFPWEGQAQNIAGSLFDAMFPATASR